MLFSKVVFSQQLLLMYNRQFPLPQNVGYLSSSLNNKSFILRKSSSLSNYGVHSSSPVLKLEPLDVTRSQLSDITSRQLAILLIELLVDIQKTFID